MRSPDPASVETRGCSWHDFPLAVFRAVAQPWSLGCYEISHLTRKETQG